MTHPTRWLSTSLGLMVIAVLASASASLGQHVISSQQVAHDVTVRAVSSDGAFVSGVLVNNTSKTLRDVRLQIQHAWLWADERNPGDDNPGRTDTYVVPDEIAPGASLDFSYRITPPLPVRSDGAFTTRVEVVGFTEVGS